MGMGDFPAKKRREGERARKRIPGCFDQKGLLVFARGWGEQEENVGNYKGAVLKVHRSVPFQTAKKVCRGS